MPGLCFVAAGLVVARLATVTSFTLAWTHSVEKIAWEEDWVVEERVLRLAAARVKGSGAGMEPPPEATRRGEAWTWAPAVPPLPRVTLRRSGATADWRLCPGGRDCAPLSDRLPAAADPVDMMPCDAAPS